MTENGRLSAPEQTRPTSFPWATTAWQDFPDALKEVDVSSCWDEDESKIRATAPVKITGVNTKYVALVRCGDGRRLRVTVVEPKCACLAQCLVRDVPSRAAHRHLHEIFLKACDADPSRSRGRVWESVASRLKRGTDTERGTLASVTAFVLLGENEGSDRDSQAAPRTSAAAPIHLKAVVDAVASSMRGLPS